MVVLTMEDTVDGVEEAKEGCRVQVDGHRGTIRYIGPVPPTKGVWLGIDWDDPSRGKHDGVYNGTRYFTARYRTSGSLVRREKVDLGQSVIQAVKERYGGPDQKMNEEERQEIQKALNAPVFEMVGFEKLTTENYDLLSVVGVRELRVNSAASPCELSRLCPIIRDLDLSKNLINSWEVVADICMNLKNLSFLDLSENRLSYNTSNLESLSPAFSSMRFLVLSKMEYNWEDILNCAVMWPHIDRFQVSYNNITELHPPPSPLLHNLKLLNIEGNTIRLWSEIEKLGSLPLLETLNLCNVGLTKIIIDQNANLFPSLKYILLSDNYINDWESVSELDKLPALQELKFRLNPILEGIPRDMSRQIVIARISRLKILNTQEIPADERRGAEYDYLKNNARYWMEVSPKGHLERETFNALHPRYQYLVKKYGAVEESEISVQSTALKSRLISVILRRDNSATSSVIKKRLPQEMIVKTLKTLVQRLFSCSSPPELTLVSVKNPDFRVSLDNEMKPLGFFSLEEGDTILVS